jgi:hypothetical protein
VAEIKQKSDKVWFYTLWGQDNDVWRIEWQVRKSVLKEMDIITFDDLKTLIDARLHSSPFSEIKQDFYNHLDLYF